MSYFKGKALFLAMIAIITSGLLFLCVLGVLYMPPNNNVNIAFNGFDQESNGVTVWGESQFQNQSRAINVQFTFVASYIADMDSILNTQAGCDISPCPIPFLSETVLTNSTGQFVVFIPASTYIIQGVTPDVGLVDYTGWWIYTNQIGFGFSENSAPIVIDNFANIVG